MVNIYVMGQDKYPRTLPKIQKLLANWRNSARTTPRPPTGGLAFTQEQTNYEFTVPTTAVHGVRKRRVEIDISTVKCYHCNRFGNYSRGCPNQAPTEGEVHVNFRIDDSAASNNNNDDNDAPDGSGEADTMIDTMDLY